RRRLPANRYRQEAALVVIEGELTADGRSFGVGQQQSRSPVRTVGKLREEQLGGCGFGIDRYHRQGCECSNRTSDLNRGRGHTLFHPRGPDHQSALKTGRVGAWKELVDELGAMASCWNYFGA